MVDPTDSTMTEIERKTARINTWKAAWDSYTDVQKQSIGYGFFVDWAKQRSVLITEKLDKKMLASGFTLPITIAQRKTFIMSNFTLAELSEIASWLK